MRKSNVMSDSGGTQATSASGRRSTDMVGKALAVLSLLGDRPAGSTLSELSRAAGYPTSTTYRLLGALNRDGFVSLDEVTKRYHLGLKVFELGLRVSQAHGFTGVALPIMQELSAFTREATLMSVLDGHQQLYVHYFEGPQQVSVTGEPGRHGPLHCTSMGKILVAFAPSAVRDELLATLDLPPAGPHAITDREAFGREIAEVARCGHAISDEEHEAGIRAVGVPVLRPDGTAIAALSAAAPAFRVSLDQLIGFVPALTGAARELAVRLPVRA